MKLGSERLSRPSVDIRITRHFPDSYHGDEKARGLLCRVIFARIAGIHVLLRYQEHLKYISGISSGVHPLS